MTADDSPSRRAFIGGAAAASLALAGCTSLRQRIASFDAPADPGDSSRTAGAWGFEDLSAWQAHNNTTLEADTRTNVEGSQSARIEGKNGSLSRNFTRPLDLSERDLTFAVRVEKPRPVDVEVFLTDKNGNKTQLVQAIYPKHPDSWVRVSPSIDRANADLGKVSSLLVTLSGAEQKRYWLDDMRFPKRSGNGARVLFTFDFATREVYETAFPVMEEHGFKGCVAVPTDRIGGDGRLTADELAELHDAGWEIASASNDIESLYGLPEDAQRKRVERAITTLDDMGFGEPRAFAYPRGELDATTLSVVREHHDFGFLSFRDSEKGLSQRTVPAPYFFNRSQPSTVDAAKNQLGPAVAYGGIYAMYWWVLQDTKGKTSPAEFRAICEYIAEQEDVQVVTPSQLLE
jgi:peptidoglycan/xylan/chitin deacetylase (PgdA/CDA1 family)